MLAKSARMMVFATPTSLGVERIDIDFVRHLDAECLQHPGRIEFLGQLGFALEQTRIRALTLNRERELACDCQAHRRDRLS